MATDCETNASLISNRSTSFKLHPALSTYMNTHNKQSKEKEDLYTVLYCMSVSGADTGGRGGQRGLLTPLQKFSVYQDRDTLIEQSL